MRVAITGAAGYVGSILTETLLHRGYFVIASDNFYKGETDSLIPFSRNKKFQFIKADVTDINDIRKVLKNADFCVHLASLVGLPRCQANKALATITNEVGTSNVVEVCKEYKLPLFFSSTGSVYGKVQSVCYETTPLNALSLYGTTKIAAENLIRDNLEDYVIYRYATGYGCGNTLRINLLVNDLVYQSLSNKCMTIFEADAFRTFIHVIDMADSIEFAIKNFDKLKTDIYNVGDNSNNATKRQLAEMIKAKTGCHVTYAEIGNDGDFRDYTVSYDKINKAGWRSSITLEEGIDELIKAFPLIHIKHQYE